MQLLILTILPIRVDRGSEYFFRFEDHVETRWILWRERVYAEELEPAYARGAYAGSHLVQGGALDLMSAFSSSAASRSFDWLVLRPLFSRTSDRDVLRDYDLNRLQEVNIAVS